MKHIARIVDEVRKMVSSGARVSKVDQQVGGIELIEEPGGKQVEILDRNVLKPLEYRALKPQRDVFALDSSTRVVETPYVFIGVGAGSVFSRFSGRGLDVPTTTSILGLEEPICKHLLVIPELDTGEEVYRGLVDVPGVITQNPAGERYTSSYNKHAALIELRLSLENCLLERFIESPLLSTSTALFLDGPLAYPRALTVEVASQGLRERVSTYLVNIDRLNEARLKLISKLTQTGVHVIGVVKRLMRSYYLSSLDPFGISSGKINDEAYIETLITRLKPPSNTPLVIGPIRAELGLKGFYKVMWYFIVPRRLYPSVAILGNYVVFRVEVPESSSEIYRSSLGILLYDSIHAGGLFPLSILVVDKRVKKISSSLVTYLLYLTGLSEESTGRYITLI